MGIYAYHFLVWPLVVHFFNIFDGFVGVVRIVMQTEKVWGFG